MKNDSTPFVITIGVMFCFVVGAVVAIFIAVPEGGNPGSIAAIMFAALGSAIASLAALYRLAKNSGAVHETAQNVRDLSNGKMDNKIINGVLAALDKREELNREKENNVG